MRVKEDPRSQLSNRPREPPAPGGRKTGDSRSEDSKGWDMYIHMEIFGDTLVIDA